uniref:Uncharacterized protein n=1 Tax=Anguilla anguilla TaxID=7936 RepID=A0A0E9TY96_ANGAN
MRSIRALACQIHTLDEGHRKQRWLTLVPQSSSAIDESLLQIGC